MEKKKKIVPKKSKKTSSLQKKIEKKKSTKPTFRFVAKKIPEDAGCYLFWDKNDELLYVGKAKNLRKRVTSYFQKDQGDRPNIGIMVSKIVRIETRVTHSEMESLILENNLVKEKFPRYNVRLRDDKNFVYLHITNEEFPKMEIVRRIIRDGSTYIGPKTSTKDFRETVRFCQKFFRIRMVHVADDYYPYLVMGELNLNKDVYNQNVKLMKQFLNGKTDEVVKSLHEKMMKFAQDKNFEAAAKTRDLLKSISASTQKQAVQFEDVRDRDFVSFVREEDTAYFVRLVFRNGQLLDQNEVVTHAPHFLSDQKVLEEFLMQFYPQVDVLPEEIYVPLEIENSCDFVKFLCEVRSEDFSKTKLEIIVPQRGEKKNALLMAEKNAKHFADRKQLEQMSHAENFAKALPELAEHLGLSDSPKRIECYDISHFSGVVPVASLVVFIDGEPFPKEYRRFHVKNLPEGGIDDFAAMREILTRRFARREGGSFAQKFPDLIVIDGGKGQLSAVMDAVRESQKAGNFPEFFDPSLQIIALAKREEEIFRPGKRDPLLLSHESSALKLLQRVRDEAHRFAITFNRSVREKIAKQSVLDTIPSIGPTTKKQLMQKFGSVSEIRTATDEELAEILSEKQLENLRKML